MHSKKSNQKLDHRYSSNSPLTFNAIGTAWTIDITPHSRNDYSKLSQKILQRIEEFDQIYSRFRDDSLISMMYSHPGTYKLPPDAFPLLTLYTHLYRLSHGTFTPLIGTLLSQAGYDKDYSFITKELTELPDLDSVLTYTKDAITLKENQLLDFGAGGKGYLVDLIGDILEKEHIHEYCIDASGDIYSKSENPIRVGLEHPENPRQVIGVTSVHNQAICASATNRRKWKEFHHIINPLTLSSPHTIRATWVIADSTILADALSTCLFLTPPADLLKEFSFEYLILYSDYTIQKSDKFHAELYYN